MDTKCLFCLCDANMPNKCSICHLFQKDTKQGNQPLNSSSLKDPWEPLLSSRGRRLDQITSVIVMVSHRSTPSSTATDWWKSYSSAVESTRASESSLAQLSDERGKRSMVPRVIGRCRSPSLTQSRSKLGGSSRARLVPIDIWTVSAPLPQASHLPSTLKYPAPKHLVPTSVPFVHLQKRLALKD